MYNIYFISHILFVYTMNWVIIKISKKNQNQKKKQQKQQQQKIKQNKKEHSPTYKVKYWKNKIFL